MAETFLNVYEVTREYGGPEEGGWWYNARHTVTHLDVTNFTVSRRIGGRWRVRMCQVMAKDLEVGQARHHAQEWRKVQKIVKRDRCGDGANK